MDDADRIGLDTDELPLAKTAFHYIADRRLMSRIARLQQESSNMVREPNLPIRAKVPRSHLDPADWRTGFLSVHDYDLPFELFDSLKECAPQALLRDLFRPEFRAFVWQDREVLVSLDRGGVEALRDARAAQRREPIPYLPPLTREVQRHAQAWRTIVSTRWKPILDDDAPRKLVVGLLHDPTLS